MSSAHTTNLAEALYLLEKGNRFTGLTMIPDWPTGIEAFEFVFEGEHAEADHREYIACRVEVDITALPLLFGAIEGVLPVREARV
jgi:hypothetical protein